MRELFSQAMSSAGLRMPASTIVRTLDQAAEALALVGLPCIVRPAFTLGGRGGGVARTEQEFHRIIARGIEASPIGQVLVDQSVIGWGESVAASGHTTHCRRLYKLAKPNTGAALAAAGPPAKIEACVGLGVSSQLTAVSASTRFWYCPLAPRST